MTSRWAVWLIVVGTFMATAGLIGLAVCLILKG